MSSHADDETKPVNDFPTTVNDSCLKKSLVMEESSVSIDMADSDDEEEEEDEDDDEDEDELRKRVEEFIEKTNRGWREEKMNICCSLHL